LLPRPRPQAQVRATLPIVASARRPHVSVDRMTALHVSLLCRPTFAMSGRATASEAPLLNGPLDCAVGRPIAQNHTSTAGSRRGQPQQRSREHGVPLDDPPRSGSHAAWLTDHARFGFVSIPACVRGHWCALAGADPLRSSGPRCAFADQPKCTPLPRHIGSSLEPVADGCSRPDWKNLKRAAGHSLRG
jgi:hypothetical protein